MEAFNDLTGRQFGFLVVAAHAGTYKTSQILEGALHVVRRRQGHCGTESLMRPLKELRMRCPGKSARENDAPDDCRKVRSIQSSRDDGSGGTSSDEACIRPSGMQ